MTNSERHQMTVPKQVPSERPDPVGPVADRGPDYRETKAKRTDQKVLGVLTGQVPVHSMPIATAAPEPEEDDDEDAGSA